MATSSGRARSRKAPALARELRAAVRGEVRFDRGTRAMYSTDASNYRQVPIGVVLPRDAADVEAALAVARRHDAPVLARGGGTSLAGQCCNVAVVLDLSRHLRRILEVDPVRRVARVEPGVVLDDLRDAAERHGLTFGPDPATHDRCTLGGMIGNNSCGVHSLLAGKTDANVESLEVVTWDGLRMEVGATSPEERRRLVAAGGRRGEIYRRLGELAERHGDEIRRRFPRIPRNVSGYNLGQLLPENGFHVARALVGTEGTCALVLAATVRLVPSPRNRVLVVAGFADVFAAADAVPEILATGPIGLEGIDDHLVRALRAKRLHLGAVDLLPPGRGWLLVEMAGDSADEAAARTDALVARLGRLAGGAPAVRRFDDPRLARTVWKTREAALGATAMAPGRPPAWEGWEDAAVPPERLGSYLRRLMALLDEYGYHTNLYGHFGEGCVHTRIDFDLESAAGIGRFREFVERAAHLVVEHGGSLSGEHGDGQARAELLPILFGERLTGAFREFKAIWDPAGRMNPGKVVDPHRLDEDLRLGADYRPWRPRTVFAYPEDDGDLSRAALRCVGVGACRRESGGTMCPSYRATGEELHSTRGRARLLFEMLRGDVVRDGWRSREVRAALDLCLACKACRAECPALVDMATYKAEFLHHHYRRRLRPAAAYALGLSPYWLRLASRAPRLANALLAAPALGAAARAAAGIAPGRALPRLARRRFRRLWRPGAEAGGERVLLWPDTFNDRFRPATALAAGRVLERSGYRVELPPDGLCCGRPFYDFGFLGAARRHLRRILAALADEIAAGTLVVGVEPSCVAVFRDELPNLFPDDPAARALSRQVLTLAEALARPGHAPPLAPLEVDAVLQGHCHHQAVMGMGPDRALLDRAGVRVVADDHGCCGMAGAFGFQRRHAEVSRAIGERALLPRVRATGPEALVIADGFSCREQIEQGTGRRPLHLAEVLLRACGGAPADAGDP